MKLENKSKQQRRGKKGRGRVSWGNDKRFELETRLRSRAAKKKMCIRFCFFSATHTHREQLRYMYN
jgi:hypothetical protein